MWPMFVGMNNLKPLTRLETLNLVGLDRWASRW
jgi:hypothetical protein